MCACLCAGGTCFVPFCSVCVPFALVFVLCALVFMYVSGGESDTCVCFGGNFFTYRCLNRDGLAEFSLIVICKGSGEISIAARTASSGSNSVSGMVDPPNVLVDMSVSV